MKRPPGLWILLSAGVLWLSLRDVYGIRATSLIFGKSSTSTTTSTEASEAASEEETVTTVEPGTETSNVTKPPLTGVPQIDYIWDPNLPQELNGYNLSEYPFYERVPEEIDFKCDGLHDGFYASVTHKCQVYHHCLFGTRFDFLCANYTAFDQKTFICHFVSEVDCVNSKKFWHRNDALYVAQSTTTLKPLVIYTTPPAVGDPITPLPGPHRRPAGGRRPLRPLRRPQFEYYDDEYYDDYYEERPRANRGRKRPRPRPRPVYDDDEYAEYEDERLERPRAGVKRGGDRRRPYDRRPSDRRRNKERRKQEYDDDEEVDDRFEDEDYIPGNKRKSETRRKPLNDDLPEDNSSDRKRPKTNYDKRRSSTEKTEDLDGDRKPVRKSHRRPSIDYEDDPPQADDSRVYEDRPRKSEERSRNADRYNKPAQDARPIIKPVSGTIYDRPRVAPRINLPVPKHAADKFAYKSISSPSTTAIPTLDDEEYYDDEYEEEPLPKRTKYNRKSQGEASEVKPKSSGRERDESKEKETPRKQATSASRPKARRPIEDDDVYDRPSRPKHSSTSNRPKHGYSRPSSSKRRPVTEEYYDDYEQLEEDRSFKNRRPSLKSNNPEKPLEEDDRPIKDRRPSLKSETREKPLEEEEEGRFKDRRPALKTEKRDKPSTSTTTTTTSTTTESPPREKSDPIIRVVKRPFLPSRGGNPYSARGLQPVGAKAVHKNLEAEEPEEEIVAEEPKLKQEEMAPQESTKGEYQEKQTVYEAPTERKPVFKPSPVLIKVPVRSKFVPTAEEQEMFDSEPSRLQAEVTHHQKIKEFSGPRTTQKPKLPDKDLLDLNEYDVTLNDALNPTLPNLPVRGFPTGFSSSNDYSYSTYQRPRYVVDAIVSPSTADFMYHTKPHRHHQTYEVVPQQGNARNPFPSSNTNNGGYRQRGAASQTQAYYSNY